MNSRIAVAIESVLLAVAALFLAFQVFRVWPRVTFSSDVERMEEARLSGDPRRVGSAVLRLVRRRPGDASLRLVYARTLLSAGKFDKAAAEYARAAKVARKRELRAAAEIGRGTAILSKSLAGSMPPTEEDLAAALDAAEKAKAAAPRLPDAKALLAVVHLWSGKPDLARAEVDAVGKEAAGLEGAAALCCVRGYLASAAGEAGKAHAELLKAGVLVPQANTPLGKFVADSMQALRVEASSQALEGDDPPAGAREAVSAFLKAEGAEGVKSPEKYPTVLRAATALALVEAPDGKGAGMATLGLAIAARQGDPVPYLARAAVRAAKLVPLFEKAEEHARRHGAVSAAPQTVSLREILPGGGGGQRPGPMGPANAALKQIEDGGSAALVKDLEAAAALLASAGDEKSAERAFALLEYRFGWLMRMARLSTGPQPRRKREREAAAAAVRAGEILGTGMPAGRRAAALMRNAGVLFAGQLAWGQANECFGRSLELFPGQPDLRSFLKGLGEFKVAAVYPAGGGRLRPEGPLVGAEFSLAPGVKDLASCEVTAMIGPKGGPGRPVTPVVSGTGVWYVPKKGEIADGALVARFRVKDPLSNETEAVVPFVYDMSPPRITSRHPAKDAVITDRNVLFRIGWSDPSGLAPESVEVRLEPVTAVFAGRYLVQKGLQKSGRYQGKVKWKAKAPVVPKVDGGVAREGEIVTGIMSPLPKGAYRLRVRLRDVFDHKADESWQFEIR